MGSAQIAALSSGLHDSLLEGDGFELPSRSRERSDEVAARKCRNDQLPSRTPLTCLAGLARWQSSSTGHLGNLGGVQMGNSTARYRPDVRHKQRPRSTGVGFVADFSD